MKRLGIFVVAAAIFLAGCGGGARSKELRVYAAASLTDAFTEIGKDFEIAHPEVRVSFNFGGSQTLRAQIEQGAQADVFAPANLKEMETLARGNYVGAAKVFLTNRLVVVLPAKNPGGVTGLEDLARSGLKVILAAQEAPVGGYSLQALEQMDGAMGDGYKDKVLANVVSYENDVKLVVAKIQLGEADAGIVYASDAAAAPELQTIEIPAAYNVVARYPIAALVQSQNAELAEAFIAYVLSADGQATLRKWGFESREK